MVLELGDHRLVQAVELPRIHHETNLPAAAGRHPGLTAACCGMKLPFQ
jgi:hypothetical protein